LTSGFEWRDLSWALNRGGFPELHADAILSDESGRVQLQEVAPDDVILAADTATGSPKSPRPDSGPPSPAAVQQREAQLRRLQTVVVRAANISVKGKLRKLRQIKVCTDEPKGVNASEVRRQLKSIPFRVEYISI
jgi:hypothetical protein